MESLEQILFIARDSKTLEEFGIRIKGLSSKYNRVIKAMKEAIVRRSNV